MISKVTVIDLVPFGQVRDGANLFALRLSRPEWPHWKPGQFIMLRKPGEETSPLLARPLSICRVSSHDLVLFFQEAGRMTSQLAKTKAGDVYDLWGPLGNGFYVERDAPTLLLAGGVGIAPFVGYVENHPTPWAISMEFGHRLPVECYPLHSINQKVMVDTFHERGPEDLNRFIGRLEERFIRHLEKIKDPSNKTGKGLVLACGPTPFLRTVQQLAKKYGVRAQLGLETRMACGVGACLGCVVKVSPKEEAAHPDAPGFVQTCTCGPCFWADEIVL